MKRENQNGDDDSQNEGSNGGNGGGGNNAGGNGGGRGNKRFRGNDETIRLLIPSRIAGAIIGKGGQHINRLRAQYKATINVEDCQGPERTVHVSAEFENAISIVEEMLKNFDEKEDEFDVRMLIHQSLAGCVIGKGGSKIKEIRDKIGCRILKVFSNVCPQSSDRIVQCVGKADQAVESIREILDLVKEVPIKGPVQNYDPINYDDLFADKYGGFGDNGGGRGGGNFRDGGGRFDRRGGGEDRFDRRDGGRRNDRRDNNGGGGGGGNRGMRGDRDFIDPWAPNQGPMGGNNFGNSGNGFGGGNFGGNMGGMGGNMGGNMGGGGGNMGGGGSFGGSMGGLGGNGNIGGGGGMGSNMGGGIGGGFSSSMGPGNNMGGSMGGGNMGTGNSGNGGSFGGNNSGGSDDKNTTQVTIPKDLAGAIIGKAGGRIRRIRMESNAFITIDEPLPGSSDRIITITGSPKQIQMAQYLLQQSVREHRRQNY